MYHIIFTHSSVNGHLGFLHVLAVVNSATMNIGEGKAGLKLSIQKAKIMASGPITSWQIDGETMEKVTDFILGCSKITADGDCSHEIKRCLLLV